jgi:hypothetical protein
VTVAFIAEDCSGRRATSLSGDAGRVSIAARRGGEQTGAVS